MLFERLEIEGEVGARDSLVAREYVTLRYVLKPLVYADNVAAVNNNVGVIKILVSRGVVGKHLVGLTLIHGGGPFLKIGGEVRTVNRLTLDALCYEHALDKLIEACKRVGEVFALCVVYVVAVIYHKVIAVAGESLLTDYDVMVVLAVFNYMTCILVAITVGKVNGGAVLGETVLTQECVSLLDIFLGISLGELYSLGNVGRAECRAEIGEVVDHTVAVTALYSVEILVAVLTLSVEDGGHVRN